MPKIYETIGLGIGEETKGAWAEYLANITQAKYIWRKGGPQSGHHVTNNGPTAIMLSQFGAGTLQGIPTLVDMPVIPTKLIHEALKLEDQGVSDPLSLIKLNASSIIVTPYHQAISRLREILRPVKRGTIGLGVGDAMRDVKVNPEIVIRVVELDLPITVIERKIEAVRISKLSQALKMTCHLGDLPGEVQVELDLLGNSDLSHELAKTFALLASQVTIVYEDYLDEVLKANVVIETSHGALLHPRYGFVPHVTQIDPTGQDALKRAENHGYKGQICRLGVLRVYGTRFGAGPFVTYNEEVTTEFLETDQGDDPWLGKFRKGYLDIVSLKYAIKVCGAPGLSGLLVSFMDALNGKKEWKVCTGYRYLGTKTNLDKYFVLEGDVIREIKFRPDDGSDGYLAEQAELTQLLFDCVGELETITASENISLEDAFTCFLENKLRLPIVALSYGPGMKDKSLRPGYENFFKSDY